MAVGDGGRICNVNSWKVVHSNPILSNWSVTSRHSDGFGVGRLDQLPDERS